MDDFVVQVCVICTFEKNVEDFCRKYSECKACNFKNVSKQYYTIKSEFLQTRRDEKARLKDLDNRTKALEEKLSF